MGKSEFSNPFWALGSGEAGGISEGLFRLGGNLRSSDFWRRRGLDSLLSSEDKAV